MPAGCSWIRPGRGCSPARKQRSRSSELPRIRFFSRGSPSPTEITVPAERFLAWQTGTLIQCAFPDLTTDQRELLISGICGKCFDRVMGEEPDEEVSDVREDDAARGDGDGGSVDLLGVQRSGDVGAGRRPCPYCDGAGSVRSHSSIAIDDHITCPACGGSGEPEDFDFDPQADDDEGDGR